MKNQIEVIAKFNSYSYASTFAEHSTIPTAIILGDDNLYWIVTLANMEKALNAGYELA